MTKDSQRNTSVIYLKSTILNNEETKNNTFDIQLKGIIYLIVLFLSSLQV